MTSMRDEMNRSVAILALGVVLTFGPVLLSPAMGSGGSSSSSGASRKLPPPGSAQFRVQLHPKWDDEGSPFAPWDDPCLQRSHLPVFDVAAIDPARTTGLEQDAEGFAWVPEMMFWDESNCVRSGQGLMAHVFHYIGEEQGMIRSEAWAIIHGWVDLQDAHCAATSAGLVQALSPAFDEPVRAVLDNASAASDSSYTSKLTLGKIVTGSIDIGPVVGMGKREDRGIDFDAAEIEVNLATFELNGDVVAEVWALDDAPPMLNYTARCEMWQHGYTWSFHTLGEVDADRSK
jgi:hypothetical protein